MTERAFRVNPESDFHKKYFLMWEEKKKFANLAHDFFKKNGFSEGYAYATIARLCAELSPEDHARFAGQYKVQPDKYGLYTFKKRSPLQRQWEAEVVSKVDMSVLSSFDFWYWSFINSGSYALWQHDGVLYGYLSQKSGEEIKLADYMEPIKMSEYYAVIESMEAKKE